MREALRTAGIVALTLLLGGLLRLWPVGAGESVAIGTGTIILIESGTCPTGFAEATALSGKVLVGTVDANSDVGTTGGADTITPAGTVAAPTFAGTAGTIPAETISWPAGVPTFAGSALGTHQHGVGALANAWPAGVPTFAGTSSTVVVNHVHIYTSQTGTTGSVSSYEHGAIDTSSTAAEASISTNNPTGGAASYTPAGSIAWPAGVPALSGSDAAVSAGTPAGTNAWPAGVPTNGTVSFTPAGTTSAPAFTGTSFDNRPAFVKVIFCKKS